MNVHSNTQVRQRSKIVRLDTLVENRQVFTLEESELNVYETLTIAELVHLRFPSACLASMITGKKVMHLRDAEPFEFFPGESVILRPNELMQIDFPVASETNPTRCLALAISERKINEIEYLLNEKFPKTESLDKWNLEPINFHFTNDANIDRTLNRMIHIFMEDHPAKDIIADYTLNELIIRLMQTRTRHLLIGDCDHFSTSHRLAYAVRYIRDHLHEPISIKRLCDKACMSRATFFRAFKNELGMTPVAHIIQQRIELAKQHLRNSMMSVSDACFRSGFHNVNYFIKIFKYHTGITPNQYKRDACSKGNSRR